MKKYKLIVQIEKIKKYLEQGKLQEAYDLAEYVDPKKLKSMTDLSVIAECYFQNRRYLEAKELFEQIYDTVKTRRILAQLVHLSIKLNDIIEANYYLEEFMKIAPEDFYQYIFRYSIDKMMKKPLEVLIKDLENLREVEYIESWAYELAKLYFKSGNEAACRKECEKIILWFGSGEYVDRAKALLAYYDGELDVRTILNAANKETSSQEEVDNHDSSIQEELEEIEKSEIEESEIKEVDISENEGFEDSELEDVEDSEKGEYETSEIEEVKVLENEEFETSEIGEVETAEKKGNETSKTADLESVEEEHENSENVVMEQNQGLKTSVPKLGVSKHTLFHKKYSDRSEELPESMVAEEVTYEEKADVLEVLEDREEFGQEERISKVAIEEEIIQNNADEEESIQEEVVREADLAGEPLQNDRFQEKENMQGYYEIEVKSNHEYIPHLHSSLWPYLEEKEILLEEVFGNFLRLHSFSECIIDSLERMVHSVYGQHNLVLMGHKDSGQVELAKKYAKLFHKLSFTGSPRVALIDAVKLNHMDLMGKRTQLKDCIMILQNTEELTRDTLIRLMELQQLPRQNIFYILTGQTEGMEQLFHENEELTNAYPIRISIPEYDFEDYCGFAYDSITDAGYKIEKEAFLLVRNQIWEIMKLKRENTFTEVLSYVKQIIQKHEKQNEQLLLDLTRAGALEQFNLSVLKEEDIG